ncbi:MAG: serine/threonine-protein kinase [Thermomicrobiales bacterium]
MTVGRGRRRGALTDGGRFMASGFPRPSLLMPRALESVMTDPNPDEQPEPASASEDPPETAAAETTPSETAAPGAVIIGARYEIDLTRPLSTGGAHAVYPGKDLRSKTEVVVKTLRAPYREDAEERVRFRREARMMAFLKHRNIVRIEAFIEEPDAFWVVQERLTGGSIAERLELNGPFPPEEVAPLLEQAADALTELHARGAVHLALSPRKLMCDEDGQTLKLLDLGHALPAGSGVQATDREPSAAPYHSPEQRSGAEVSPASDLYALGCIAFEALTGTVPLVPTDSARVPSVLDARPELPKWIDGVLARALAEDPADRYNDVRAFARAYRAGVEGHLTGAPMELAAPVRAARTTDARQDAQWMTPPPDGRTVSAIPGAVTGEERVEQAERARRPFGDLVRWLWLAVAALLAINLLLGLALVLRDGALPPFGGNASRVEAPAGTYQPGSTAVVLGSGLLARTAPAMAADPVAELVPGEIVTISGAAVESNGGSWWPVTITRGGKPVVCYVQNGWLRPRS